MTMRTEDKRTADAAVQAIVLLRAWHDQDEQGYRRALGNGLEERVLWTLLTMLDRSFHHLAEASMPKRTWHEFVDDEMSNVMALAEQSDDQQG